MDKYILIQYIKYGPALLAITCGLKIHLSLYESHPHFGDIFIHWVNWLLNLSLLVMFYAAGKYFHFCWKHRSLCRIALYGYLFYATVLIFNLSNIYIDILSVTYMWLVLIISGLYSLLE